MLNGKTALVTGSSSGIGLGIATALARAGAGVFMHGIEPPEQVEPLRARIAAEHGAAVRYLQADVASGAQVEALFAAALADAGAIDILVNNAGIQHVAPIAQFPVDKWEAIIAINLVSAFHTTRLALPAMQARRWGRIVNIASAHALVASPFKSAYVAAKHGIAGLTKTVALEVAEEGITVNAICPGYVRTALVERQIPDTARARGISEAEVVRDVLLAAQPTREFVTVEQVAALVLFLCGAEAASITGALLPIDGGWTAR